MPTFGLRPLASLLFTLALALPSRADIIGTTNTTVTSNSTAFTTTSQWYNSVSASTGEYQMYSNSSDATLEFTFIGVAVQYTAEKKFDRGFCSIMLDGGQMWTLDLYATEGSSQSDVTMWESGLLLYGSHSVIISQLGIDSRIGFYPYLFSEDWTLTMPVNAASYTATEGASSTSSASSMSMSASASAMPADHSSSAGAAAGGAVGGLAALGLIAGALFYCRRRRAAKATELAGAGGSEFGMDKMRDERPPTYVPGTYGDIQEALYGRQPVPLPSDQVYAASSLGYDQSYSSYARSIDQQSYQTYTPKGHDYGLDPYAASESSSTYPYRQVSPANSGESFLLPHPQPSPSPSHHYPSPSGSPSNSFSHLPGTPVPAGAFAAPPHLDEYGHAVTPPHFRLPTPGPPPGDELGTGASGFDAGFYNTPEALSHMPSYTSRTSG